MRDSSDKMISKLTIFLQTVSFFSLFRLLPLKRREPTTREEAVATQTDAFSVLFTSIFNTSAVL